MFANLRKLPQRASTVFWLLVFAYWVWWIDPRLQLFAREPPLFLSSDFLLPRLAEPSGALALAAALLLQGSASACLGAAIGVACLGSIGCAFERVLRGVAGAPATPARWMPVVCLLALESRYDSPILEVELGLLAALGLAAVQGRLRAAPAGVRVAAFLGLSAVAFHLLGGFYLYTVLGGVLLEWGRGSRDTAEEAGGVPTGPRRRGAFVALWGPAAVAAVGAPMAVLMSITAISWKEYCLHPLWFEPVAGAVAVPVSIVLGVAVARFWPGRSLPKAAPAKPAKGGRKTPFWTRLRTEPALGPVRGLVLSALVLGGALLGTSRPQRAYWQLSWHARQGRWSRALGNASQAARLPMSPARVAAFIDTCHGLFETGRLAEDQFSFPQIKGVPMLPKLAEFDQTGLPLCDVFLELGQVNYAQHWAYETLEIKGERPDLLARLARIHRVKGENPTARIYLNLLLRHPRWRADARQQLAQLDDEARSGMAEAEVARLRARAVRTDLPAFFLDAEPMLRQALEANPRNRMAFEYLMAHYLRQLELDKFAASLRRLRDFSYPRLPRHYEEALLLARHLEPDGPAADPGPRPRQDTVDRFEAFLSRLAPLQSDPARARAALRSEFGTTFWFHATCSETVSAQASPPRAP